MSKPEIYYKSERCTLWCGDCLEVLPTLAGVDAVVTDPPYGVTLGSTKGSGSNSSGGHGLKRAAYVGFDDTPEHFVSVIVPRLNLALDVGERGAVFTGPHIHEQRKPDAIGGVYCPSAAGRHSWGFKNFLPVLLYGTAPDLHLGAKHPTTISSTESSDDNGHPCPKPLGWMRWLVALASRERDTILDPFMGSGTTGVAAVRLGRKFIGIEIDEGYCAIAKRRIQEAEQAFALFEPPPQEKQTEMFGENAA